MPPSSPPPHPQFILTLSCADRPGIVGAVGSFLADNGCNIIDSAQFGDVDTGRFMMRVLFERLEVAPQRAPLAAAFADIGERFAMRWELHDAQERPRVLIMVSRLDHCLNDLLYRYRIGALPMDPVAIVSNHRDTYRLAASYDIPFFYLPVTNETRVQQESKLWAIIEDEHAELVVLARYMQVLSNDLCRRLEGRAINIHHSFLPSFKGRQAVPPGLRARRQADRRDRALRDPRSRRGPDHRAGSRPRRLQDGRR
jgi:formyltetrahydrofolate deformylase